MGLCGGYNGHNFSDRVWYVKPKRERGEKILNVDQMKFACDEFMKVRDFTSFSNKPHNPKEERSPLRQLDQCFIEMEPPSFYTKANNEMQNIKKNVMLIQKTILTLSIQIIHFPGLSLSTS